MRPLHHTDTDPGWINRKFKDLDRQLRQLRTTTVVDLSAADPSTLATVDEFEYDVFTASSAGAQTLALSYTPKDKSEHVRWHPGGGDGIFLLDEEWTRDAAVISIPDPDGIYKPNDKFSVKYAREGWAIRMHSFYELVSFEASGWKHLIVNPADATDRSAPAFDDSGWTTSAAAYGNSETHPATAADGWPTRTTQWDTDTPPGVPYTSIWLRREIAIPEAAAGQQVRVQVRIDNKVDVYWNGVLVGTDEDHNWKTAEFEIPEGDVDATNTLAIRGEDWGFYGYLDVRVTAGA